jgi:hypothetical protein
MRPRSYTVPLVVLSVALFGLLIAIAVVVGSRLGADDAQPCVVGTWLVTRHEERVAIPRVGSVTFTGGAGVRLRLAADGTGTTEYGDRALYAGTSGGRRIELVVAGRTDFRYEARDGAYRLSGASGAPTATILIDGVQVGEPTPLADDPTSGTYTCADDRFVQREGGRLTVEYERAS